MRYIPVLTFISSRNVAFEIHIISEREQKQIGIASAIFNVKADGMEMAQYEYYVPEEYRINEAMLEESCKKFYSKMKDVEKMVVE